MHTLHYAANIRVYDVDFAGAETHHERGRVGPRKPEHVLAKYTGKSGYNFNPSSFAVVVREYVLVRGGMTKRYHEGDHDD